MGILMDRRLTWNNLSHPGMQTVARIRVLDSIGLGYVVVITDCEHYQGSSGLTNRDIDCLVCILEGLPEVESLNGYDGFDSAMWFLGTAAEVEPRFFRVREHSGEDSRCYGVDWRDGIQPEVMDMMLIGVESGGFIPIPISGS